MAVAREDLNAWLAEADIPPGYLTPEVLALLQAVFAFRLDRGADYFSTRLLSHFLLHCHSGLKVAHIARLLSISRPTASCQHGLSSKQAIQQAHHRLDGRPYGKLLARFAGPIAAFLLRHPHASRAELIAFVHATFSVRVSRIALYKFLKKYGLDQLATPAPVPVAAGAPVTEAPAPALPVPADSAGSVLLPGPGLVPPPAPPFSTHGRNTPVPS